MGFRFQKRIRIFKGLTLNLSKSGTSWTVGGPGAAVNLRGKSTKERALALIGIAHPAFRDELTSAARKVTLI